MAISTNAPTVWGYHGVTPDPTNAVPFAVNATTADAASCEEIKEAPGAGKSLVLTALGLACDGATTVTIGEGETGGEVTTVLNGDGLKLLTVSNLTEANVSGCNICQAQKRHCDAFEIVTR